MNKCEFYEEALIRLAKEYCEKRSDVSDIVENILEEAKKPSPDLSAVLFRSEHRFVKWAYRGDQFTYDTLTTLVETDGVPFSDEQSSVAGDWKILNTTYED